MSKDNALSINGYLTIAFVSVCLHASFLISMSHVADRNLPGDLKDYVPVRITRDVPPESKEQAAKTKIPIPPKPKILKKVQTFKGTVAKAPKTVKPVQGIAPEVQSNPKAMAVPMGNTTMLDDKGEQSDKSLSGEQDLSAQPQLIRSSIEIPQYTQEALDSNIEGTYDVEVYVDENGKVIQAELKHHIGYGMDDRVLAVARKAHFVPGRDKFGKEFGEWTQIKFRLQIP